MEAKINKDINIQINRELVRRKIADIFDEETANEYVRQIENHEIYVSRFGHWIDRVCGGALALLGVKVMSGS